ncbi:glycosyltransferase family 4 protein [Flavobacterium oreochromis]|uniref:Glycosyltransferase family 4 protein n=1 Tax=Flavobacterium oreochromis TaxID=2906078 RepID=A0ABW8P8V6_9FLAO|nr:glycosyltransferase family 4 protein [Flavobacterium oreochromis]OWP76181.1 hypothetical protein BWG23_08615 [Flavobacterium oreochromis]
MKSNILIWNTYELLARQGGPSTYLYNLQESLNKHDSQIHFLNDYIFHSQDEMVKKPKKKHFLKMFFYKIINKEKRRRIKQLNKEIVLHLSDKKLIINKDLDLNQFDIIHFHTTFDLFNYKNYLKNFKGKIILTSHSPKLPHQELVEDILKVEYPYLKNKFLNTLQVIDEYAFKKADYIIFPCNEAMEPYYQNWDKFKEIIKNKDVRYFLTATKKATQKLSREAICEKYAIPLNSFIITFSGRHNKVKGYDLLKEFGNEILSKYENVYFVITGKEEPITGLNHPRWIEVGWTDDPHSIIAASDLYILPNRNTYFDLVLLEVISLNIPIILSYTGGNKFFKKFETTNPCFNFFEMDKNSITNMEEVFSKLYLNQIKNKINNDDLFDTYFQLDNFGPNYIKLIEDIKLE